MTGWSPGNPFGGGLPGSPDTGPDGLGSKPRRINSQSKGKRAERALATWWRYHGFPDAARAVKTGDRFAPDGGDLVLDSDGFRLVVEVKHHAGGLTDGQVAEYGAKLIRQVRQSAGTMGVLIERRDRVSDPGRWWAHVDPRDFAVLTLAQFMNWEFTPPPIWQPLACRTTVEHFAMLLRSAGLAKGSVD